jgi:hypothetical protein
MSEQQLTRPVDAVIPIILQAVVEWKLKNTDDVLKKRVINLLDKNSEEITLKLLGFNKDRFDGKWSLDHCNGRSGESAAGDFLRKNQAEAITKWLSQVPMPTLSQVLTKQLQAEAKNLYINKFRSALMDKVEQQAERDAAHFIQEFTKSQQIGSYVQMMRLLNQEGNTDES